IKSHTPTTRAANEFVKGHHCYDNAKDDEAVVFQRVTYSNNKPGDGRQRFVAKQVVENQFEPRHNENEEKTHDAHSHCHHDAWIDHCRYDFVFDLRSLLLKFRQPGEHQFEHAADLAGFDHVDV